MKQTLRKAVCAVLAGMLLFSLCIVPALATVAKGHAVYRDLNSTNDFFSSLGHAGLVYARSGNTPTVIIHHPGGFGLNNSYLEKVSFSEFKYPGGNTSLNYYGSYYVPNTTGYNAIGNLANTLWRDYHLTYVFNRQLSLKWPVSYVVGQIEPEDLLSIRCDGLVEYCYEYHGIRLLGTNSAWNISDPAHYTAHTNLLGHTPATQRACMTQS